MRFRILSLTLIMCVHEVKTHLYMKLLYELSQDFLGVAVVVWGEGTELGRVRAF